MAFFELFEIEKRAIFVFVKVKFATGNCPKIIFYIIFAFISS